MIRGALDGVKILDLGRVIAAPYAAAFLADMGADVVKVEQPGSGDDARQYLPLNGYFACFNRSKKGITLNLKTGKDVFLKLVEEADVVIENFRPGVMKKLGLDYEELKKVNPRLIYCAVSAFGQEGPYSQIAGYDPLIQAMSGIVNITGEPDGEGYRCGAPVCDVMSAMNAAYAIVCALRYRDLTGKGQMIDIAIVDQGILAQSSTNQFYLSERKIPQRLGNGYAAGAPGNSYYAKDGKYMFAGSGDAAWKKICNAWGKPELIEDERFADRTARTKNRELVDQMMNDFGKDKTVEECLEFYKKIGLAVGPVNNTEQVYNDPHFGKNGIRQMFATVDYPGVGEIEITNQAVKMSESQPEIRSAPPVLGQDNEEIYKSLGYSMDEIKEMKKTGII